MAEWLESTIPMLLRQGSALQYLAVFGAGVLASLSPCVYPLIPVIVGIIANMSPRGSSSRIALPGIWLSLSFVIGLSLTFAVLGVSAALAGRVLGSWNFGFGLLVGLFSILMGLSLLGLFEIRVPALNPGGRLLGGRSGVAGAFVYGIVFGLVATPCATPILATVLSYVSLKRDPLLGAGLLFSFGLGQSFILFIAGAFAGAVARLPKPGKWLSYTKFAGGLALIAVGIYFILTEPLLQNFFRFS